MNQPVYPRTRAQRAAAPLGLPDPGSDAAAHSARLSALLRREMDGNGGAISFARFMEMALYAPGLGYYSGGSRKFGAEGDFVTAPEISPLFSRCIARQAHQVLEVLGDDGVIVEAGAGSGVMAAEVLLELERLNGLPRSYFILELSAELRERQRATLQCSAAHLLERVEWLDTQPQSPLRGVVLANELLDAMPVHLFRVGEHGAEELFVTYDEDGFHWRCAPVSNRPLEERLQRITSSLPDGYQSEIGLAAERWLHTVGTLLEEGVILLIDYGFPEHEFYHPQRNGGTLMCHYRHRAHPDPLILPGLQDITCHVNFTALAETATAAGLELYGYTTQAHFLLATGLEQALREMPDGLPDRLRLSQQVRTLTMPQEMGELFKVMAVGRGLAEIPLQGFMLRDLRGKL
ncbi:MAG TPA: SAM-dependent methyltransferase [Gammaproteobacteria bacterium]|nr:SAM-dependent methyltransferase [Gammaproteobacteria bacterium]